MSRFFTILSLLISQLAFAQTAAELHEEAKTLRSSKQPKTALERINKAIELDSRQADLFVTQALIYADLRDWEGVSLSFDKAFILAPEDYKVLGAYGIYLREINFHQEAIPYLEKAAKSCPNLDTAMMFRYSLGGAYLAVRNPRAAEKEFMKVYEHDSTEALINNSLALLCMYEKRYPEALIFLQKLQQYDTERVYADVMYTNLGFVYQSMNEHERALPYFDKCIEVAADEKTKGIAYCNRGYSKLQLGRKKAALEDLEQSLKLHGLNAYAWRVRAEVYLALKKKKKACEDLQMAIDLRYTERWGDKALELQRRHCK